MKLPRRSFLLTAAGSLFLPEPERVRAYSFLPGYELLPREDVEFVAQYPRIYPSRPTPGWEPRAVGYSIGGMGSLEQETLIEAYIHPDYLNDYRESARVWGINLNIREAASS